MTRIETLYPPSIPAATTTRDLSVALGVARAQLHRCEPPPRVLAALQRSLNIPTTTAVPPPAGTWQVAGQWMQRWRWSAAVVLLLLVLVAGGVMEIAFPPGVAPTLADRGYDVGDDGFMPVVNAAALPSGSTAWLVRTEMSRQQLASLGLPFDPARAAQTVPAEVLLRPNGELLAVRLVR